MLSEESLIAKFARLSGRSKLSGILYLLWTLSLLLKSFNIVAHYWAKWGQDGQSFLWSEVSFG